MFRDEVQIHRRDRRGFDRDRLSVVRVDVLFQSRYVSVVENSESDILFLRSCCTVVDGNFVATCMYV